MREPAYVDAAHHVRMHRLKTKITGKQLPPTLAVTMATGAIHFLSQIMCAGLSH